MNTIVEIEVNETTAAKEVTELAQPNAITELDTLALSLIGGGSVSPFFE